nr:hypothetical protein [uncultured Cohaesibacter sp.]
MRIYVRSGETVSIPWASSEPIGMTVQINGQNHFGKTPNSTATVSYYSPYGVIAKFGY